MLSRFDYVFVVMYNGLEFLFNCFGEFGGESNIGFEKVGQ
jgi:hypothetical protein